MDTKKCKNCLEEKATSEFSKNNAKKDKLDIYCKVCARLKAKNTREQEKIVPNTKTCNICKTNKPSEEFDKQSSSVDGLSYSCKLCLSEKRKNDYSLNKDKYSSYNKKKRIKALDNDYEGMRAKEKESRIKRKDYQRAYHKSYKRKRRKEDINFRLIDNLRSRMLIALKGRVKSKRTEEILGCTIEEFKNHIESQFLSWMNWSNYGNCETEDYNCSWHLDHIIPVSYAETEEEVYLLNHWSNFQPLCGQVNLEKNKYATDVSNIQLGIYSENKKLKFFK